MKSIFSREIPPVKPREYPYLAINKNHEFIVLFSEPRVGVIVYSGVSRYELGKLDTTWYEENFEPFHGYVTISA